MSILCLQIDNYGYGNYIDNEETDDDEEYLDSCGLYCIVLYSYEEVDDHQSHHFFFFFPQ